MRGILTRRKLVSPFEAVDIHGLSLTVGGGGTRFVLSGPRLRSDARGGDGGVRKELAPLTNAQATSSFWRL
jgi:hypothetical protein